MVQEFAERQVWLQPIDDRERRWDSVFEPAFSVANH